MRDTAAYVWGMEGPAEVDDSALAINVSIPQSLQWHDTRRGEDFVLTSSTSCCCRTVISPQGVRPPRGRTKGCRDAGGGRLLSRGVT